MKKFFFGDQRSTLFTLCIVLGALMAIGLPLWQQVPFAEVPWHIGYWTMLPIVGTFGLIQQHSRQKR